VKGSWSDGWDYPSFQTRLDQGPEGHHQQDVELFVDVIDVGSNEK
jgi:hypothetical protein